MTNQFKDLADAILLEVQYRAMLKACDSNNTAAARKRFAKYLPDYRSGKWVFRVPANNVLKGELGVVVWKEEA